MVRKLIFLAFLLACLTGFSQKFKSQTSHIRFFSDAPMEDIEAINESASSIIDLETNAIVMVIPIKSFDFKKKLMQEHFNENYLESDKYPRATFKGKLEGWDQEKGISTATAVGTLEIHGVANDVSISGEIAYDGNSITVEAIFPVVLEDYEVKIPKAVFYNIAEEVEVTAKFEYKPYEKN